MSRPPAGRVRPLWSRSTAFALLLILPACTGLHERNVPDSIRGTLPDHYGAGAAGSDAAPPLDNEWWRAFGDATLDRLVEQALRDNGDLAVGAARLLQARAIAREEAAARWPTLGAFFGAQRQRELNPLGGGTVIAHGTSAGLNASYELDLWGRLNSTAVAARQRFLAQGFNYASLRLTIEAELVRGYLQLQAIDAQVTVLTESVALLADAFRLSEQRYRAGSIAELDLAQVRAELEDSRAALADTGQQARATRRALLILAGLTPSPEVSADTRIEPQQMVLRTLPEVPVGLPSQLLDRRPDLREAEARLAAARADLSAARRAFLPSVSLTASGGRSSQSLGSLLTNSGTVWSLGANVAQTIFAGGRLRAQEQLAAATRTELLETYRNAARSAYRDVLDALDARSAAIVTFGARQRQAEALERALHLAQRRYDEGYSGYLDVLDARRSLLQTRLQEVQARSQADSAFVSLAIALGGGWSPSDAAAPIASRGAVTGESSR